MARPSTCDCGECPKCKHRLYMREWKTRNRDRVRESARRSRERNLEAIRAYDRARGWRPGPIEKRRARKSVQTALEQGRLVREPCEVCGNPRVQAHHEDYGKPLDVQWLCTRHHGERHRTAA